MAEQTVFQAILSLISLCGIVYLVFWAYRAFLVDKFRDNMFILRNELFDDAASGLIEFDHLAYGMLRSTMNGFIRFGHRLNLWHAIFLLVLIRRSDLEGKPLFSERWTRATQDLNPDTKTRLDSYHRRMDELVVKHLIIATPEFYPVFVVIAIIAVVAWVLLNSGSSITSWAKRVFVTTPVLRQGVDNMDTAAFAHGKP